MSRNPVNNLDSILDKDAQKKARELLKSGALLFCCLEDDGRLNAILRESAKSVFHVNVELKGKETVSHCNCGSDSGLCVHAAAAIVHYFKYSHIPTLKERISDKKPVFAGIDQKELDYFFNDSNDDFKARITLELEAEMPHSPSRWASCIFEVNMNFEKRSYKGSFSNLRQILFDKTIHRPPRKLLEFGRRILEESIQPAFIKP